MRTCAGAPGEGAGTTLELERFMPYRLSVLSGRISRALAREYQTGFDLTIPEWRVMVVLGRLQPLSAGAVAARTEMDKVKVSRAVAAMERKGLLHRTPDPKDQRAMRLALTSSGMAVYADLARFALDWEARLLDCLGQRARVAFGRALTRLSDRLDRLETEALEQP